MEGEVLHLLGEFYCEPSWLKSGSGAERSSTDVHFCQRSMTGQQLLRVQLESDVLRSEKVPLFFLLFLYLGPGRWKQSFPYVFLSPECVHTTISNISLSVYFFFFFHSCPSYLSQFANAIQVGFMPGCVVSAHHVVWAWPWLCVSVRIGRYIWGTLAIVAALSSLKMIAYLHLFNLLRFLLH